MEAGDQLDTAVSDQTHHAPAPPQLEGPEPWGTRFMRSLGHNLHYLTFLPLVLLGVLQVFNVLLAAALSTAVACLILLLGFRCHKAGHVKVCDNRNSSSWGAMGPRGALQAVVNINIITASSLRG